MWDRPEILNNIANALIAVSVLLIVGGGLITLANLPAFPVRQIKVSNAVEPAGDLHHVTYEQIQAVATQRLNGTFFSIDLEAARTAFAALPWVRSVDVRRSWPDRLDVAIEEQVALANWSGGKLVNTHGELFDAALIEGLPAFSGPEGSEGEVTKRYREFSGLLGKLNLAARQVALSPRLAWELRLDNGLDLKLGREQPRDPVSSRMQRFVAAYADTVGKIKGRLVFADLRYQQGFALQVPPGATQINKPAATESTKSEAAKGPRGRA